MTLLAEDDVVLVLGVAPQPARWECGECGDVQHTSSRDRLPHGWRAYLAPELGCDEHALCTTCAEVLREVYGLDDDAGMPAGVHPW